MKRAKLPGNLKVSSSISLFTGEFIRGIKKKKETESFRELGFF